MSQVRKSRVFYVVRPTYDTGCGHQHARPTQARNCAVNLMAQHKSWDYVNVVRVRHGVIDAEKVTEKILEEVTR